MNKTTENACRPYVSQKRDDISVFEIILILLSFGMAITAIVFIVKAIFNSDIDRITDLMCAAIFFYGAAGFLKIMVNHSPSKAR